MSVIDEDIKEVENVEDKIVKKLEECATFLLSCELENKKCKKCKDKDNCLIFIRSVVAALCRIQIAQMTIPTTNIAEQMFI